MMYILFYKVFYAVIEINKSLIPCSYENLKLLFKGKRNLKY